MANDQQFKKIAAGKCDWNCQPQPDEEIAGGLGDGGGGIGANHDLCAMRQKHEIHDAKNQGQTGCNQKQGHTSLQAIKGLFKDKGKSHKP